MEDIVCFINADAYPVDPDFQLLLLVMVQFLDLVVEETDVLAQVEEVPV